MRNPDCEKSNLFQYMLFKLQYLCTKVTFPCICAIIHITIIIIFISIIIVQSSSLSFFLSYFSPSVCPPVRPPVHMFVSSWVSIGWFVCVPPYTKLVQKNKKKGKVTILYFIFLQGNQWASPSEEESIMDMQLPLSSSTATPNNQSSEDDHKAPKLYFDVDEAKEKKYATYEDLRKKHRERWNPPSLSSSSQTRKEQVGKVDRLLKRFS